MPTRGHPLPSTHGTSETLLAPIGPLCHPEGATGGVCGDTNTHYWVLGGLCVGALDVVMGCWEECYGVLEGGYGCPHGCYGALRGL